MGGSGVVGVEVDALYGTGGTISGRSGRGGSAAKGLKEGLDSAHGVVGHPAVKAALGSFVSTDITEGANRLGRQIEAAGRNVADVAATARDSDNTGAAALSPDITEGTGIAGRINRQL